MRRITVVLFVVALVTATWAPTSAQTAEGYGGLKAALGYAEMEGAVHFSSHLIDAMRLAGEGLGSAEIDEQLPIVTSAAGGVEVELRYDTYSAANVAAAEAAGLEIDGRYPAAAFVTGVIAPSAIRGLADVPGLATVHPMYGATTRTGSVENQADVSHRADQARTIAGIDGSGVEIGILSDSFDSGGQGTVTGNGCNQAVSGTSSQNTGDLPASVRLVQDLGGGGSDEGRGMAELIHDLAPGADLSFRTAFLGEADFAQGIHDLANCGADVIVDDVGYFAEPMFQDGVIAQAADDVAKAGIPYFSSAGNQGTYGIDDMYVDVNPGSATTLGDEFHDFGGGDAFAKVTLDPGEGFRAVLQWNDPFSGSLGPGASSDYDLAVFDEANISTLLAASASVQGCGQTGGGQGGDPLEIIEYVNPGPGTDDVFLIVDRFCSTGPNHLRIATYGVGASVTDIEFESDIFTDSQQYGHATAKNARSVAAVFYGEIDDPTVDPPNNQTNVEPFSSLGGDIPIYFNRSGAPVAGGMQTRFKPEIAAADGSNTSFFGADIGFDPDSDPNFFGTSAAAPHAAAIAALVLDANPGMSRADVYDTLEMSAIDIETSGPDPLSGHGLVDALAAVSMCNGLPATIIGTAGADNIIGTAGPDVIVTFGGNDFVNGKGGNDTICLGGGADTAAGGSGQDTIFGGAGADELNGQKGADYLDGGGMGDTLIGGGSGDTLIGGVGADTLQGDGGADELMGDDGDDVLDGGDGNDTLFGGKGKDSLMGGTGADTLKGEAGVDTLLGGDGADTLHGGGSGDTLRGGNHADLLFGQAGNDTLNGEAGNDSITGGAGADEIRGGAGRDTVDGSGGADDIRGGGGNDTLSGSGKNDTIRGEAGDDTLNGGGGSDTLLGGAGTDAVTGGPGTDTCVGETKASCEL